MKIYRTLFDIQIFNQFLQLYYYALFLWRIKNRTEDTGFLRAEPLSSYFEDRKGHREGKKLLSDKSVFPSLTTAPVNDEAKKHNENLPGMGGVFNVVNLHLYHYAGNNPVKYTDPDGNFIASYFANTKFNNAFNFFIEKYQKKLDTINRASQLYQQIYDIPKNTALEDAIVFDKEQAYDYILTTAGINAEQMGYEKNSEEYNNYVKQETKLYSKLQELRKQKYTDGTYKNGLVDKILNTALNLYNNKYQECISEGLSDIEAMKHADSVANEYLNKTLEDNEL